MKRIVGIATHPGREETVKRTIESLRHQVDEVFVWDNAVNDNLTDNGKFRFVEFCPEDGYYFSCDSDLLYPPDYAERMIAEIERHNAIVTIHGRILKGKGLNYYWGHRDYRFTSESKVTVQLDVCGTGVTAFKVSQFRPTEIWKSEDKLMSDLVFSLEAAKQGVPIVHIPHETGWVKQQVINIQKSIAYTQMNRCDRQNEIADEIYEIRYNQ